MTNRRRRSCARGECPLPRRTAIGVADGHGTRGVQPGAVDRVAVAAINTFTA
ncbi:hypothetical protein ACFY71_37200 [Streptomyces cinerochromogenes]|uniref:hypothetical protein n=1 Tax=Streptomyces cinerochromogenes TaxID=66422 RepID=UPI0036CCB298